MAVVAWNNTFPSPASTESPVREPQQIQERQELIQTVKAVNAAELFGPENEVTFVMDRHTRKPVVRIVNRDTREVVQEIPPKSLMQLARLRSG
jgi:uncharacterized FlaG/YvyC family protein